MPRLISGRTEGDFRYPGIPRAGPIPMSALTTIRGVSPAGPTSIGTRYAVQKGSYLALATPVVDRRHPGAGVVVLVKVPGQSPPFSVTAIRAAFSSTMAWFWVNAAVRALIARLFTAG